VISKFYSRYIGGALMGFFETSDNNRGVSKRPAPFPYPSDAPRSEQREKPDNSALAVVFTPLEQLAANQPEQTGSLIRRISPVEIATALSRTSQEFTDPTVLANARTIAEAIKSGQAFVQEFQRVHGRPPTREELGDDNQRTNLFQGHEELKARWQDFEKHALSAAPKEAAHEIAIQSLQRQAQKAVDDICGRMHLPPVQFEFTKADTTRDTLSERQAYYRSGTITMPEQRLADGKLNRSSVVDGFAHEIKHHEQLVLATAKSIEDVGGDKPLDETQIKAIQSRYKNEFGLTLTEKFILDVQQWKAGHKLTKEERDRGDLYQRSFAQDKTIGEKEDQIALLATIGKTAKEQSAWEALKILDASVDKLPSLEKVVADGLLERYRKIKSGQAAPDTWTEEVETQAKNQLAIVTSIWIRNLQEKVLRDQRNSPIHSEADRAGREAAEAAGGVGSRRFQLDRKFQSRDGGESGI
jgi:hypothetical protein